MTPMRKLTALMLVAGVGSVAIHGIFFDPVVADDGEHALTPQELATIVEIEALAMKQIRLASQPDHLYKRDAHPAPHGCVQAEFHVNDEDAIDEELRHGVLAQPGKKYDAWVRFSNGLFADDNEMDARGMAIKLMGVPGDKLQPMNAKGELVDPDAAKAETQDFVMINNPTFPIDNVDEFKRFFDLQVKGDMMGYFLDWNPLQWRLREMRVGFGMLTRPASPLSTAYFSMLPYRLGREQHIKFSVLPCDPDVKGECQEWELPVPDGRSGSYLREALVEQLTPRADDPEHNEVAARFAFRVQRRIEGENMPIEHASIEWDQDVSPYVEVATLRIKAQRFSTQEQNEFCENLSFSPWHALPAHEPVGNLNRARRVLYNSVSEHRHEMNGVKRHEPRGFCLHLDGRPCEERVIADRGQP